MEKVFAIVTVLLALFSGQVHSQSKPAVSVGSVFFEEYPIFCKSMDGIQEILNVTNREGLNGIGRLFLQMRADAKEKGIEPECVAYEIPLFFSMIRFMGQLQVLDDSRRQVQAVWNVVEATARYREGKKFFVLTLRTVEVPKY